MKILNGLADEGLGCERTSYKVRMSQVHAGVQNRDLNAGSAAQARRNLALNQPPRGPQHFDIHFQFFLRHFAGAAQILGNSLRRSHEAEEVVIRYGIGESEILRFDRLDWTVRGDLSLNT